MMKTHVLALCLVTFIASCPLSTARLATVLVDDYAAQPPRDATEWTVNRMGGDRGTLGGNVVWRRDSVCAKVTDDTQTAGVWSSLLHRRAEGLPRDFGRFFPPQIRNQYQARVTGLRIGVVDGCGSLRVEFRDVEDVAVWSATRELSGGTASFCFNLPPLGKVQTLVWSISGTPPDYVEIGRVELLADVPPLPPEREDFLWSYAMLLSNRDGGLTRDRSDWPRGRWENVSASGMQAAAAAVAEALGFISRDAGRDIVRRTSDALARLAREDARGGLLPHFVSQDQNRRHSEWSSIDTVIALVALIEAEDALGLDTSRSEGLLTGIDWDALLLPGGSLSHGYHPRAPGIMPNPWNDFGTESWLVNLGYAAATGRIAAVSDTPPTWNGSGFIDELAWLLVPAPERDAWGVKWLDYREVAARRQLDYYRNEPSLPAPLRDGLLFGLSAAEVPDRGAVVPWRGYQAFGVGGATEAVDGRSLLGHAVVVPHYAAMIAAEHPAEARAMLEWLKREGLFAPGNNVESLILTEDGPVWNSAQASWNLSLQTLGWGRRLLGNDYPPYRAARDNAVLARGCRRLSATLGVPR